MSQQARHVLNQGGALQARRHSSAQSLVLRSKIVLGCDEGLTNNEIAQKLKCSPVTVSKWRRRFAQDRLDGLADLPRSGAPRTITDDVVDEFKISLDPLLIEKIRDIVGLYLSPPLNAACFAVDEKPQIQALNRTAPIPYH